MTIYIPFLQTNDRTLDKAFRIAVGDLTGNIAPYKSGLLETQRPVVLAGIHYADPWIRDAAFNVWNGVSLFAPEVGRDTLLASVVKCDGLDRVGYNTYHYWDAIVAVIGFWHHFLYTGDHAFLRAAFEISKNSMAYFEATEFDSEDGLFRGPACCMDAISAYPDELAYPVRKRSDYIGVLGCRRIIPKEKTPSRGMGIPFKALSTNCLYFEAYRTLGRMASVLDIPPDPAWASKAEALKRAINARFWLKKEGHYAYLVSLPMGLETCTHQEAMGHAFAVLFGVADDARRASLLARQHLVPAGVPYLWPTFPRYPRLFPGEYGRASGTVWPHAQAFWAEAAAEGGRHDLFDREFRLMAEHAERDSHFAEVLHPDSGEIYGGVQEVNYTSKPRQTWCATGFIRLVLRGILGMRFSPEGVSFSPRLPSGLKRLALSNLHYRASVLSVSVEGAGSALKSVRIDGRPAKSPYISAASEAKHTVEIEMV